MIDHLSISQLDTYSRCGEVYRRRYVEGEIIPPGLPARIGSGVHKGAEINFKAKIETGQDEPLDVIQDAAAEAYHRELGKGVFFSPEEAPGAKRAMAEGKDTVVSLATLFRNGLAPLIQPRLVEEKVVIDLPGVDLPVVTILDCYTKDGALRDLKTSGKKWTDERAHSSHQPTAYREAVKAATGEYPESICFDVLVSGKTPALQTISTFRTEDDLAVLIRKFQTMMAGINAGIFPPAEPGSWMCSQKWCGYWYSCPFIPAHRKTLPKRSA
jgi:hypothetical protein